MRFITISAAILLGSAMSAAGAQQLGTAAGNQQPTSAKAGSTNKAATIKSSVGTVSQATPGGSGSMSVVLGGADACASATAIGGAGVFIGDNLLATTDGTGLGFGGCGGGPNQDVWYDWTAAATGSTFMSMCVADGGAGSFDSILAVYNTASCVGSPAVVCNDTFCGSDQSKVSFAATIGSVYKVRLGGFGANTGTYSLSIGAPPPPPANDSCASAIAIAGPGLYPGTNVSSTFDGTVAPCSFGANDNDVWYNWTALSSVSTTVSVCPTVGGGGGTATFDTVLRITAGTACQGAEVACDDDACGSPTWRSGTSFAATSGSIYKIQLMGYSSAAEGTFTMEISAAVPPPSNDGCASPIVYAGGIVPWSNVAATTDGGAESCGTPRQDIWYLWNATCTGTATFSLCPGGVTPDTVVAVYEGSACPAAGTAIGCDDDTCSSPAFGSSAATFCATAGQDYLLRLGGFGGVTGSGLFEVTGCGPTIPQGTCVVLHDGSSENSLGLNDPTADVLWMHSSGQAGASTVVKSISTAYGSTGGGGPPNFAPSRVGIWSDPNGDGNPTDAVLIQEVLSNVQNTDTSILNTVPLAPPVLVTGKYFIGASAPNGTFPAPMDTNSFDPCNKTAWIVANTGAVDYNNLAGAAIPPTEINGIGFPAFWLLEAECKDLLIEEICGVVVSAAAECPCAPAGGLVGNGCPHSGAGTGSDGAHLAGSGTALIGAGDTVSVSATNVRQGNGAISLFLQGDNDPSVPFNDGLICSSNNILKLWMWKDPVGPAGSGGGITSQSGPGASTIPPTTSISQRSSDLGSPILNGQTRVYTMVFRDPSLTQGCPSPSTVNTTNGVRILWSQL